MVPLEDDLLANLSDLSMLGPAPYKETNNQLYSWAYHRFESIAERWHIDDVEVVKVLARAKGRRALALHGY